MSNLLTIQPTPNYSGSLVSISNADYDKLLDYLVQLIEFVTQTNILDIAEKERTNVIGQVLEAYVSFIQQFTEDYKLKLPAATDRQIEKEANLEFIQIVKNLFTKKN